MTNELSLQQSAAFEIIRAQNEKVEEEKETYTGSFLPYVMLVQKQKPVHKAAGVQAGDFVLAKNSETIIPLGTEFEACVYTRRPCACIFTDDSRLAYYDRESDAYKEAKNAALAGSKGHGYGEEFLLYIPAIDMCGTFHFYNKTLRQVIDDVILYSKREKNVKFESKYIDAKGFQWYGVTPSGTDTPIVVPSNLGEVASVFTNPKSATPALPAPASEADARA